MHIGDTPKTREVSKHYYFTDFFEHPLCANRYSRVTLGKGDQATNNAVLKKAHYLAETFTHKFKILSLCLLC